MRVLSEFQDASNHWSLVLKTPTSQNGTDANTIVADIVSGGVETRQKFPNNSLSAGSWYYLTVEFNGSVPVAMYLNGQSVMTPSLGQNYGYGTATQMNIGSRNDNGHLFSGVLDEIRFSNVGRSGDWIAAEYNNQSRPASFYSVATEGGQQQVASPTFSVGAGTYGSTQSVAITPARRALLLGTPRMAALPVRLGGPLQWTDRGECQHYAEGHRLSGWLDG